MHKRSVALLAAVAFLVLIGWAAEPPTLSAPAVDRALTTIRPEALSAHIRFLADDLLEGRAAGERGYDLAARYVAAHFQALGLEPGGTDGTYFQPVPLLRTVIDDSQSSFTLIRNGRKQELDFGDDFIMRGDPLRTDSNITAPLVFVGFGVSAPELAYDDYAGVDTTGKIVVYLSGAPGSFPSTQRAHYGSRRTKAETAVAHGAVGVLSFANPNSARRIPWRALARFVRRGSMTWVDEAGNAGRAFPALRANAFLNAETADSLFEGARKSFEQVVAAAKEGRPPSFPLPLTAHLRQVSRHSRLESPNVVALLHGSDPALKNEYVVYTAHLDHTGKRARPVQGDAINNGAYDNASGSAALLEVARAFATMGERPRRSVVFLAVTAEERGLLGSDYFAQHPTVPAAGIAASINMDMLLMLYEIQDVVAFGMQHSSLGAAVERAAERLGLEVSPDPFPEQNIFVRSDHYSFVRQGIPSVMLSPGVKARDPGVNGKELFQKWLRTVYHGPKDDAQQAMHLESGAAMTQLAWLVGYQVANQAERPAWNAGDFFGETFGSHAAK